MYHIALCLTIGFVGRMGQQISFFERFSGMVFYNTVKKHINNLYRKLDVVNRSQLMTNYYNQAFMLVDINERKDWGG